MYIAMTMDNNLSQFSFFVHFVNCIFQVCSFFVCVLLQPFTITTPYAFLFDIWLFQSGDVHMNNELEAVVI